MPIDRQLPKPLPVHTGQESVWSFPRPSIAQAVRNRLKVVLDGIVLAETTAGVRTIETSHPPTFYFPPEDVNFDHLIESNRRTFCEWKGEADYYDVVTPLRSVPTAAWSYPNPTRPFCMIEGFVAFYPQLMDECWVDDELASPQPGRFYGGWVTSKVMGPFKGEPGTEYW